MKKATIFILLLTFLLLIQLQNQTPPNITKAQVQTTPSTIVTYTQNVTTLEAYQRKIFYAHGKYWVFYPEAEIKFRTSIDGVTWSAATVVCTGGPDGGVFSTWYDGTYVHYVRSTGIPTESLLYRRGRPNPDGTITWSTPDEQTVIEVSPDLNALHEPFVTVDSAGYPWIGYRWGTDGDRWPNCTKSSLNNGTWQTDTNFPYQLSPLSRANWAVSIVPLTQQKVYAVYLSIGYLEPLGAVRGRLWNGTDFEPEELIAPATISGRTRFAHSVVARENDVYLTFLNISTPNQILFYNRTYSSGWSPQETVQSDVPSTSFPVLSINSSTTDFYCFWADNDTIYYKKRVNGYWDADATAWLNELNMREDSLSCSYQAWSSRIGLYWVRGVPYTFDIRFCSLITATIKRLTLTSSTGGTTNPPPGDYYYIVGEATSATALPDSGYSFDYWLLDGEKRTENPIAITLDVNHTLEAHFVDDISPEISDPVQEPPENVGANQSVTVTATVTDTGTGVKNVTLWYNVNSGADWTPLNMIEVSEETYQTTIPGYPNGTVIAYKITAYDNAGNDAIKDKEGHYVYLVIPEFSSLQVLGLFMVTVLIAVLLCKKKERVHK
jgi:hypothetical protein